MRGLEIVTNYEWFIDNYDNPVMGGQGKYADLHPPMWSGGT
jgi:hypothetical protein